MSTTVLAELRNQIVETPYPTSANHLPTVCEEFGLAAGTREEAFDGKRAYVHARVKGLSRDRLMALARDILETHPGQALEEAVANVDEAGRSALTEITRRRIM